MNSEFDDATKLIIDLIPHGAIGLYEKIGFRGGWPE